MSILRAKDLDDKNTTFSTGYWWQYPEKFRTISITKSSRTGMRLPDNTKGNVDSFKYHYKIYKNM